MRFWVLTFCGLVLTLQCASQIELLNENRSNSEQISSFVSSLNAKNGSDKKLAKRLFVQAHKKFLKHYVAYSQVNDVFASGNFDCLSGTYFLTLALDQLGLTYKIFETNYHIFLTVQTSKGEILLECTDKDNGFITNKALIREKIATYLQSKGSEAGEQLYLSRMRMYHELMPAQLPGLLYFNRAIQSYNRSDFASACAYLQEAWQIYDNPRIEVFTPILIHSIERSIMEESIKEKLLLALRSHQSSAHAVAALTSQP